MNTRLPLPALSVAAGFQTRSSIIPTIFRPLLFAAALAAFSLANPTLAQNMIALHSTWFGPDYTTALQSLTTPEGAIPEPATLALLTLPLLLPRRRPPQHPQM